MPDIDELLTPAELQAKITQAETLSAKHLPTIACDRCKGTGVFAWVTQQVGYEGETRMGPCNRCRGKGVLTDDDQRRNFGYDQYSRMTKLLAERGLTPADLIAG